MGGNAFPFPTHHVILEQFHRRREHDVRSLLLLPAADRRLDRSAAPGLRGNVGQAHGARGGRGKGRARDGEEEDGLGHGYEGANVRTTR